MYYCYLETPIGDLLLAGDEEALCLLGFPEGSMRREPEPDWIYSEKPRSEEHTSEPSHSSVSRMPSSA